MSKIQTTLATATDVEPSKRANEAITDQSYLKRLALGVQALADAEWNKLDTAAQDWFNKAADAIEAKKDIPSFPDMAAGTPPDTGRRRGSREEAPAAAYTSAESKKGDKVAVSTKRGKNYEGVVLEADKQGLVLDVDGKDVEIDHDKIDSITLAGEKHDGPAAAPDTVTIAEVSDTVEVTTKRGKKILGNITELTDTDVVIVDVGGEIHELALDRLDGGITVKVKNAGKAAAGEPARGRRSGEADAKPAEVKQARTTAAVNGGISITTRIRELVADRLESKKEDIAAILKKEGLEFKQATLDLTFSDMHKIIGILRDKKIIK